MSAKKPIMAKGTRDFGPKQVAKRKYILGIIEKAFQQFGFEPIETPAMESLSTLMGKYGDEGDQLLFKILNSGKYFNDLKEYNQRALGHEEMDSTFIPSPTGKVSDLDEKNSLLFLTEKGLRYDLTVPFARYVVMNQHEITMPFKRYQMQPVWRADRPQKGRYREFWQCDADVVGSNSLLFESELLQIYHNALSAMGLNSYEIKLNNRKILAGMAEVLGIADQLLPFTIVLDKLDKIGKDAVFKELAEKNLLNHPEKLTKLFQLVESKPNNQLMLDGLLQLGLGTSQIGLDGINEVKLVLSMLEQCNASVNVSVEPTLARGLSYYTGCIMEVISHQGSLRSSIGGGGRYDNLTGVFGLPGVSGVGISFGLDRIYDILEELNLYPSEVLTSSTKVIFCCMTEDAIMYALKASSLLRSENINCEVYHDASKLKKQLNYANNKQIPFAVIIGSDELASGKLVLKDLNTGVQQHLTLPEIIDKLI